jgi:hypothetical protein
VEDRRVTTAVATTSGFVNAAASAAFSDVTSATVVASLRPESVKTI